MDELGKAGEGLVDMLAGIKSVEVPTEEYAKVIKDAIEQYKEGNESLVALSARVRFVVKELERMGAVTPDLMAKFAELGTSLAKEKNRVEVFGNAMATATSAINALGKAASATTGEALVGSAIEVVAGSAKKLGTLLAGVEGSFALIATPLAAVAGTVAPLVVAFGSVIIAVDAAAKAQRGAVESLLQTGQAADKLRWGLGTTVDAVLKAGTQFGYNQQEVGDLSKAMSDAGIAIRSGTDRTDEARATQQSYTEAVKLSTAMAKANGIELSQSSDLVMRLGTQFQIAGKDMEPAIAVFLKAQKESGVQFGAFTKMTASVSDSLRSLGSGFDEATGITSKWSKEILAGTVSAASLAEVYDSQSGSFDKQMQKMMMVLNFDREGAAKIGLTGKDQFADLYKFQKAQESVAGQGMIAQSFANLARQGGGSREQQVEVFKNLMETQLGFKTTIDNIEKIFKDPKLFGEVKGAEARKSPEERVAEMFKEASAAVTKFGTSGENLNKSVVALTSSINSLRDRIPDFSKGLLSMLPSPTSMMGGAVSSGAGFAGMLTEKITGAPEGFGDLLSMIAQKAISGGKQSGGLIGKTGLYRMHAGETVQRPGEGGGINVSIPGGIHVSVGDRGDVGHALDEALGKLKGEIMSEIDSQWQRAQFAQ